MRVHHVIGVIRIAQIPDVVLVDSVEQRKDAPKKIEEGGNRFSLKGIEAPVIQLKRHNRAIFIDRQTHALNDIHFEPLYVDLHEIDPRNLRGTHELVPPYDGDFLRDVSRKGPHVIRYEPARSITRRKCEFTALR